MLSHSERKSQALACYEQALRNVKNNPVPEGQKFPPGTRVRIIPGTHHLYGGQLATVEYTHAHAYGGDNVSIYSIDIDNHGSVSWFHESLLEEYTQLIIDNESIAEPLPVLYMRAVRAGGHLTRRNQ